MGVLDQVKIFLGASLSEFSVSLGWNESASQLSMSVVEDNGQVFLPRVEGNESYIGKPYYFDYGALQFGGILQSWTEDNSVGGYPVYNLSLSDPRTILDGTQVILDQFQLAGDYDQTYFRDNMPGVFNVYDLWETAPYGTFGGSLVTDMGMHWFLIKNGIETIQAEYGPLRYMGENYYFDFTGLPVPPLDYRIPGPNLSILEVISVLCDDSGCDWTCYLEQVGSLNYIKFKFVSRTSQPPLGQIKVYIDSRTNVADANKQVSSFTKGLEFRNEQISTILLGGNREDLYFISDLSDKIRPFFGFDVDNEPITGTSLTDAGEVILNSSPIADIVGVYYPCYVIELRAALYNMETWVAALNKFNPTIANVLGFDVEDWAEALEELVGELSTSATISSKLVTTTNKFKDMAGKLANGEETAIRINRVYNWIKQIAEEYYGKKFLVSLPNVRYKVDGDTGEVTFEYDIADTGFLPPSSADGLIGLSRENEPIFTDDQGKFYAFARFDDVFNKDLSGVNEDAVLEDDGNTLFMKVGVEPFFVNPTSSPFGGTGAIITIESPITNDADTALGDPTALMQLLGLNDLQIENYKKADANSFYVKIPYAIPPLPIEPTMVGIPLRSNVYSYGPWTTVNYTPGGKVRFERDESLVPWNFGGYSEMNAYAEAKIVNTYSGMTIGEMGSITEAGAPTINLGDVLKAGGPILTGLSVQTNSQGVFTTYEMRTFTPRFGTFSLQNAERIKRFAIRGINARKTQRELIKRNSARAFKYQSERLAFLKNNIGFAKRTGGTPHEGICAYVDTKSEDRKETTVASDIATHFIGKLRGNILKGSAQEELKKMGLVGMEALYRPYQTNYDASTEYLPKFTRPIASGAPNADDLNPFKDGHDINLVLKVNPSGEYENYVLQGANQGSTSGLQPIGLKAPLVLTGWGYDINGAPTPSGSPLPSSTVIPFLSGYLTRPETWKSGPVDLRWDESRGVWTGGTAIFPCILMENFMNDNDVVDARLWTPGDSLSHPTRGNKVQVYSFLRDFAGASGYRCYVIPGRDGMYQVLSGE